MTLSDPRLEPFWELAEESGAWVFVHPSGTDGSRLTQWYLYNTIGQPHEHALGIAHLVTSGVSDRHPELRLIAGHGGGHFAANVDRLDHAWHHREDGHASVLPPGAYLGRYWGGSLVFGTRSLRRLIEDVGADRVLLGTDVPYDMGVDDPVERLEAAELESTVASAILRDNAIDLGLLAQG